MNRNKRFFINFVVYIILFNILIYSGIRIIKWNKDKTENNRIIKDIRDTMIMQSEENTKEIYKVDFNKLTEQNNETIAWIKVNNTNIDYPVVKTNNNEFYLNHSFDKKLNLAGWIFADYRNKFDGTDRNIIHNMKDNSMFGSLKNILDSNWYDNEENINIILYVGEEIWTYKVFSIYKIESEDYYIRTDFENDNEYEEFINRIKERSIKNFDVDISKDDNILTLSTCANNGKNRVVLHSKKM